MSTFYDKYLEKVLKRLGAGEKEAKTLLRLLELGAQPASVVAQQMNVPRSTAYLILSNLKNLGLAEEFERDKIKYFKCIAVEQIPELIQIRRRELQRTKYMLEDAMPELKALENRLSITPKVRFIEGKHAVMNLYEHILAEEHFYSYFNPESVKKWMPEYHYVLPKKIARAKSSVKELLVSSKEAEAYQKRFHSKQHQIRILPEKLCFESDIIICQDKLYMMAYGDNTVSALEVQNRSLAQAKRQLFELLWGKLT